MSIESEVTKKWKSGIYKKYTSMFKARVDNNAYEQFVPYADYIIHRFLPENKNALIVDLGCGIGGFTRAITNAGYLNVQGVDISEARRPMTTSPPAARTTPAAILSRTTFFRISV